nr:agglutination protein [Vibrio cholerae]
MRIKIALLASLLASPVSQAISLEESVAFAMDYSPEVLAQYARYQSAIRDGDVANGDNL